MVRRSAFAAPYSSSIGCRHESFETHTPLDTRTEPLTPADMAALAALMERTPKLLILRLQSECRDILLHQRQISSGC